MNAKRAACASAIRLCRFASALGVLVIACSAHAQSPPLDDFHPSCNESVYSLSVQPDGKILVGGDFTNLGGWARNYIGRLDADGHLDTFDPAANGRVCSFAVQADSKILVGGSFTRLGGQTRERLARLNPDGTLDSTFNPRITGESQAYVCCLAIQADGKILIGGWFTKLGEQTRNNIARLNADGTLDGTFNPVASSAVDSLAVQADGRILVGGAFTTLGGLSRNRIGRLNVDGSVDTAFNPGASGYVFSLAEQPDGKILVGGAYTTLGGQARSYIGRLNPDGEPDSTFDPGADAWVYSLALQADGRVLVGGQFSTLGGQPRSRLGRLNADGTLDNTFDLGASSPYAMNVACFAVQSDGKIVVGGEFNALGTQERNNIARLKSTEPATQSLNCDGSSVTWLRGGSGPEVWRTTFEWSTNATDWSYLGAGTRIAGGWRLTGVTCLPSMTIRARGQVAGGYHNASGWLVESYVGKPVLVSQPTARTNYPGTIASFQVLAAGTGPLSIQWLKNGVPLEDARNAAGTTTAALRLTNVLGADGGGYSAIASNYLGSVTSAVAVLRVIDPVIWIQPVNANREVGQSVTLGVTAEGTSPIGYQWSRDGTALNAGTDASLTLTNLQLADTANYRVVVGNQFGCVTSATATLTVSLPNLATLDTTFNPSLGGSSSTPAVSAIAVQPDGKVLLGGAFTTLAGQSRNRIGRLNADGTLDTGFNPQANARVYSIALQPDGKILVGGDFTTLSGSSRNAIGRLNPNGTLDTGFARTDPPWPGYTVLRQIRATLVQPDGKIMVGGYTKLTPPSGSTTYWGFLERLNTNGTTDTAFSLGGSVMSLALQADGKILVGGEIVSLQGHLRNRIGRLNLDGTLDAEFDPNANNTVWALAVQEDGKIVVGGKFTSMGGLASSCLARLNADGTLDNEFLAPATRSSDPQVYSLGVQTDGKILVGGYYSAVGGQLRSSLARLEPDGTPDPYFRPTLMYQTDSLAIQADGKILLGGYLNSPYSWAIRRLNNSEPATQELSAVDSTITWLRRGTSPEVWRTSFELAPNGTNWATLGDGVRVTGGWELAGVSVPPAGSLRARGFLTGGGYNGSSWYVETLLPLGAPPQIILDDGWLGIGTNGFGFNLAGVPNQRVLVEASTNLQNWQPLKTNTFNSSLLYFSDPANTPARFYRARLVP